MHDSYISLLENFDDSCNSFQIDLEFSKPIRIIGGGGGGERHINLRTSQPLLITVFRANTELLTESLANVHPKTKKLSQARVVNPRRA